jgi:hypothetical protein
MTLVEAGDDHEPDGVAERVQDGGQLDLCPVGVLDLLLGCWHENLPPLVR